MTQSVVSFMSTWAPTYQSTINRDLAANIQRGGNNSLSAGALGQQAIWASPILGLVAKAVSGPLALIARLFQIAFSFFIGYPLAIISAAVRENTYEGSLSVKAEIKERYFKRRAVELREAIQGTVTVIIDGEERHFLQGEDVTGVVENTFEIEKDGKKSWYLTRPLFRGSPFSPGESATDPGVETVMKQGVRTNVKLLREVDNQPKYDIVETKNGKTSYYLLGQEVAEPVLGTDFEVDRFRQTHYFPLMEVNSPDEATLTIKANNTTLHYNTGVEIDQPRPGSKSFVIDGKKRHFASASHVKDPFIGLSGAINVPAKRFLSMSPLPTRLGKRTKEVLTFVHRHFSNVIRATIFVAGLIFAYLGSMAMAAGILVAVVYQYLDHDLGIIPLKMSLFMEQYMPVVSNVGMLIAGSIFFKIFAGISLLMYIPSVNLWMQYTTSKLSRKLIAPSMQMLVKAFTGGRESLSSERTQELVKTINEAPTLEEFDAPFSPPSKIEAKQIREILDAEPKEDAFNPAFMTKDLGMDCKLRKESDFGFLLTAWDKIGKNGKWLRGYKELLKRLADDDRFIEHLKGMKNFAHIQKESPLSDFEEAIAFLAKEKNVSPEQFTANWVRQELAYFVKKLQGGGEREGETRLLYGAMESVAKIIPFLKDPGVSQIDLEDILKNLGIEGGRYCNLGAKRAADASLRGFIFKTIQEQEQGLDFSTRFKRETFRKLYEERLRLFQEGFHIITEGLRTLPQFKNIASDIHLYDAFYEVFKRTLFPISKDEILRYSIGQIWDHEGIFLIIRHHFLLEYQRKLDDYLAHLAKVPEPERSRYYSEHPDALSKYSEGERNQWISAVEKGVGTKGIPDEVREAIRVRIAGPDRVLDYLRLWVQKNGHLKPAEKEELLGGVLRNTVESIADHHFSKQRWRLYLYTLGIFKRRPKKEQTEAATVRGLQLAHA